MPKEKDTSKIKQNLDEHETKINYLKENYINLQVFLSQNQS